MVLLVPALTFQSEAANSLPAAPLVHYPFSRVFPIIILWKWMRHARNACKAWGMRKM